METDLKLTRLEVAKKLWQATLVESDLSIASKGSRQPASNGTTRTGKTYAECLHRELNEKLFTSLAQAHVAFACWARSEQHQAESNSLTWAT
jgi:hypothetical protein